MAGRADAIEFGGRAPSATPIERLAGRWRETLPVREYGTCAGVRVPAPAAPRRLFDRLRGLDTPEHTPFEGGLASVHRRTTRADDAVVIVGGGFGITTAVAASTGADVTVFEPDPARLASIRRTLGLNDLDPGSVTLRQAVVGELRPLEAERNGRDTESTPVVEPADLPPCDVLELDCEGAELAILEGLPGDVRPRVFAVEIHPIKLDGATGPVLSRLRELGYAIERRLTHDGAPLDRAAFADLLEGEEPALGGPDHQAFPPVVVAER